MNQTASNLDQKNDRILFQDLDLKVKYLGRLRDALKGHNDRLIYKLLNTAKYYHVIEQKRYAKHGYTPLVKDLFPQLSHYLSIQLIKYLRRNYPFFYYHETKPGRYQIYFGDWWGHKLFGNLDVINVKFNFDSTEYNKLKHAFSSKVPGINISSMQSTQRQNHRLNHLIKTQNKRKNLEAELKSDLKTNHAQARMPWNANRLKADRSKMMAQLKSLRSSDKQASDAKLQIQRNQQKMLEYSKENTVIGYEKRCIKKYFGDLAQFNESNKQLYYNYVSNLLAGGKE